MSFVDISYSPQTGSLKHFSPWICHFHVRKVAQCGYTYHLYACVVFCYKFLCLQEIMKRTGLKEHSIIDSLYRQCKAARTELKISVPDMLISNK